MDYLKDGSPAVLVLMFLQRHMVCSPGSINDYLSTVHIKTTGYDWNNLCIFRWTTVPCRAGPELFVAVSCSPPLHAVNQLSLLFRLSADIGFVDPGIYQWALYQLEILLYRGHHSGN